MLDPPGSEHTHPHRATDRWDPEGQLTPPVSQTRAGLAVDRRDLAVGEVAGDEVTTIVTTVTRRTWQCKR